MKKNNRFKRRNMLKLSGATVAALTGATGVVAGNEEEMVEYVGYYTGSPTNRTKIWQKVPYEHWAVRFTACDLRDEIYKQVWSTWGDDSLLSVQMAPMAESPTGFGVEVKYSTRHKQDGGTYSPKPSIDEVRRKLPDKGTGTDEQDGHAFRRENIPIRVIKSEEYPVGCTGEGDVCQDPSTNYTDFVPGGITTTNGTDWARCTLAAVFTETEQNYGEGWITSGHAFGVGDKAWHYYGGDTYLGKCKKKNDDWLNEIEWAYVQDVNEISYAWIADEKASGNWEYDVEGIVTDDQLVNDTDTAAIYHSHGNATCLLKNYLHKTGGFGTSFYQAYHDVEAGDSGGPLFKVKNGDAYIAGKHTVEINSGDDEDGDSCADDVQGTTAETVENKAGGYWDW